MQHNTNNYLVLGCLSVALSEEHSRYLSRRIILSLRLPNSPAGLDRILKKLRGGGSSPRNHDRSGPVRRGYLQKHDILLVPLYWNVGSGTAIIRALVLRVSKSRQAFRVITTTGKLSQVLCLSPSLPLNHLLSERHGSRCECGKITPSTNPPPPTPARVTIKCMALERVGLYWHVTSLGWTVPVGVTPFHVDDSVPNNKEIAWSVQSLFLDYPGGPPGMRAEHLRKWLVEATQKESLDATYWKNLVAILQAEFRDSTIVDKIMWNTVVLIKRGNGGDFQRSGFVEVLWKTVTGLLNHRLTSLILLCNVLNGF